MKEPIKQGKYVGLVLGTTLQENSFSLTIDNIHFVVLSTVLKSTFGGVLSSQLKKDYSELENGRVRRKEKVRLRVKILIKLFEKIKGNNELGGVVLRRVLGESRNLGGNKKQLRKFFASRKATEIIEEELDEFELLCEEKNDRPSIDTLFTFLVPLQKLLKNENNTSKRLSSLIWRYFSLNL